MELFKYVSAIKYNLKIVKHVIKIQKLFPSPLMILNFLKFRKCLAFQAVIQVMYNIFTIQLLFSEFYITTLKCPILGVTTLPGTKN